MELLKSFSEQIFRERKRKNMVDFDDVMHYASKILDDPMAAEEYREKFTYIFIDEFQDSTCAAGDHRRQDLQETISLW